MVQIIVIRRWPRLQRSLQSAESVLQRSGFYRNLNPRHRQHLHPIRHPDHFCHVQFSADGGGSTAVGFVQCHLWGGTDQCEGGIIEVIIVIMIIMLIIVVSTCHYHCHLSEVIMIMIIVTIIIS